MKLETGKICQNCTHSHFDGARKLGRCTRLAIGKPSNEKELSRKLLYHYKETGEIMPLALFLEPVNKGWIGYVQKEWDEFVAWVKWYESFGDVIFPIHSANTCAHWNYKKSATQPARRLAKQYNIHS